MLKMFTLCMSRGHHSLQDTQQHCTNTKQIKGGYLLRYAKGFLSKRWCEEWFVLYEDSTLAWFPEKGIPNPKGYVRLSESPELVAVGEWTRQVPKKPHFPRTCRIEQILAIGTKASRDIHWLIAQSSSEVNDWITAISNTLPPPPQLPLENKNLAFISEREIWNHKVNGASEQTNALSCQGSPSISKKNRNTAYDADHTVLSGVVIDWGHGWGWGANAVAHHAACVTEAVVPSFTHCHLDYNLSGLDECDWSAFADFAF